MKNEIHLQLERIRSEKGSNMKFLEILKGRDSKFTWRTVQKTGAHKRMEYADGKNQLSA